MTNEALENLKAHLAINPHIKTVYVRNDTWVFIKRDGFEEKTREEILGSGDEGQTKKRGGRQAASEQQEPPKDE